MNRFPIPTAEFLAVPFQLFGERWLLLTSGTNKAGAFNPMTISWGSLGVMWGKPMAMVVVRPQRFTYRFMEETDGFTLCAFPDEHRQILEYCGQHSGRDGDKASKAGLTPETSTTVAAPSFAEAELVIECRKMYFQDFNPANFLSPDIAANYTGKDYHRMYLGEILAITGVKSYRRGHLTERVANRAGTDPGTKGRT
jgi:flavin reductase (DIM6/NTAB) family NADH-FMN oxidoreductase RutF